MPQAASRLPAPCWGRSTNDDDIADHFIPPVRPPADPMPAGLTREERVRVMMRRLERGEHLYHPADDGLAERQGYMAGRGSSHIDRGDALVEQRHDGLAVLADGRRVKRGKRPSEVERKSEAERKRAAKHARRVEKLMAAGLSRADAEERATLERDRMVEAQRRGKGGGYNQS